MHFKVFSCQQGKRGTPEQDEISSLKIKKLHWFNTPKAAALYLCFPCMQGSNFHDKGWQATKHPAISYWKSKIPTVHITSFWPARMNLEARKRRYLSASIIIPSFHQENQVSCSKLCNHGSTARSQKTQDLNESPSDLEIHILSPKTISHPNTC